MAAKKEITIDSEKFRTLKVTYNDKKECLDIRLWPVRADEIKDHRDVLLLDICHRLITNVKKHIWEDKK